LRHVTFPSPNKHIDGFAASPELAGSAVKYRQYRRRSTISRRVGVPPRPPDPDRAAAPNVESIF
jgi:hypothetical protein